MNYKVDNNNLHIWHATCLCGYVYTTYDHLVEVFGQPRNDIDKTMAHWTIQFDDGEVATIYDWKSQVVPKNLYAWHIGGRHNMLLRINEILKLEEVALDDL